MTIITTISRTYRCFTKSRVIPRTTIFRCIPFPVFNSFSRRCVSIITPWICIFSRTTSLWSASIIMIAAYLNYRVFYQSIERYRHYGEDELRKRSTNYTPEYKMGLLTFINDIGASPFGSSYCFSLPFLKPLS